MNASAIVPQPGLDMKVVALKGRPDRQPAVQRGRVLRSGDLPRSVSRSIGNGVAGSMPHHTHIHEGPLPQQWQSRVSLLAGPSYFLLRNHS